MREKERRGLHSWIDLYIILQFMHLVNSTVSAATGKSTPTEISRLIATVLPESTCDASGQFRVYTETDLLVAHCIHQNVC